MASLMISSCRAGRLPEWMVFAVDAGYGHGALTAEARDCFPMISVNRKRHEDKRSIEPQAEIVSRFWSRQIRTRKPVGFRDGFQGVDGNGSQLDRRDERFIVVTREGGLFFAFREVRKPWNE